MEAIKYYVKGAFTGVQETPEVLEQQEELIADLSAKVDDLVTQGRSDEEALGIAIASVGDLSALVSEFGPAEELPVAVPTAALYAKRLHLHVVGVSVGIGAVVMVASAGLGALFGLVHAGAGLSIFAVLAAAVWWMRSVYLDYRAAPDALEIRDLVYEARFRKALATWAAVSVATLLFNVTSGTDFWSWPIWVAGGTWALTVKVEEWFAKRPEFAAPREITEAA